MYILGGCFEYESRTSSGCNVTLHLSWPLTRSVSVSSKRRKFITCNDLPLWGRGVGAVVTLG